MQDSTFAAERDGRLDATVKRGAEVSNNQARRAVRTGKVFVDGQRVLDPGAQVTTGARIELKMAAPDPARNERFGIQIVHRDDWLVVVDKPAGLLSTPTSAGESETALHAVRAMVKGGRPIKVVHRLDKLTSGLMVFARGVPSARAMRRAIESRTLRRTYRCVVRGAPEQPEGVVSSMLLRDAGHGRRGSRRGSLRVRPLSARDPGPMPGSGKLAVTRYRVVHRGAEATAVEVRLSTGRSHQIRIHLAELGCPILGEKVYARDDGAPRQALHSALLSVPHPDTDAVLKFESRWPADLATVRPRGRDW